MKIMDMERSSEELYRQLYLDKYLIIAVIDPIYPHSRYLRPLIPATLKLPRFVAAWAKTEKEIVS